MSSTALCLNLLFQSTLPHGSDTKQVVLSTPPLNISIHAPSRERLRLRTNTLTTLVISIHAPSRERRAYVRPLFRVYKFQSTLPHGSDSVQLCGGSGPFAFQSTLPHGSDRPPLLREYERRISIHAPSRERPKEGPTNGKELEFQSTLPHGSDPIFLIFYLHASGISIHAPSRERQTFSSVKYLCLLISIHAPSRERLTFVAFFNGNIIFQSTLPHGSDRCSI